MRARIVVNQHTAKVYSPYECRSVLRTVPGRKWDRTRKCWIIPVDLVDSIADELRAFGCDVTIQGRTEAAHSNWAVELLAAVGPQRTHAVYRALSRVLHPDSGGSTELQQALNAAYEQTQRSTESNAA